MVVVSGLLLPLVFGFSLRTNFICLKYLEWFLFSDMSQIQASNCLSKITLESPIRLLAVNIPLVFSCWAHVPTLINDLQYH